MVLSFVLEFTTSDDSWFLLGWPHPKIAFIYVIAPSASTSTIKEPMWFDRRGSYGTLATVVTGSMSDSDRGNRIGAGSSGLWAGS